MRQRLLSGTALGFVLALSAGRVAPVQADCTPAATNGPDDITCAAPYGDPYVFDSAGGDDTLTFTPVLDIATTGSASLYTSSGSDTVILTDGSDFGISGDASLMLGPGEDTLKLSSSSDIAAGSGQSVVLGENGDDLIWISNIGVVGGDGPATLAGGSGNDTVYSSDVVSFGLNPLGDATLLGNSGADLFSFHATSFADAGQATADGGGGADRFVFDSGSTLAARTGSSALLLGGGGGDTLTLDGGAFAHAGAARFDGGQGNDFILAQQSVAFAAATGSQAVILGGSGADSLLLTSGSRFADEGTATLFGGTGGDLMALSGDSDVAFATGASALIAGDGGDDTLWLNVRSDLGQSGQVTVEGGSGNDSLFMKSSSDVAEGSSSQATLFGGGGNDRYDFSDFSYLAASGQATAFGGSGLDLFAFHDDAGAAAGISGQASLYGDGASDTLFLDGGKFGIAGQALFDGGGSNDTVAATGAGDLAFGGTALVFGGDGDDLVTFSGSNAEVAAGSGSQASLFGGSGIDRYVFAGGAALGHDGSASIAGGIGGDLFSFSGGAAAARNGAGQAALFGEAGNDTLALTGGAFFGQFGDASFDGGDGDDLMLFTGAAHLAEAAGSSALLTGGSGEDLARFEGGAIFGLVGAATLYGGSGTDTLSFADATLDLSGGALVGGGDGDDTLALTDQTAIGAGNLLDGGAGSDLLRLGGTGSGSFGAALAGALTGVERLDKEDSGTWLMQSGYSFAGSGTIGGGALRLQGVTVDFGGGLQVLAGGRLQGSGSVGGTVGNLGSIAPGDPTGDVTGTLTLDGDFAGGGLLALDVDFGGDSDLLRVTGAVSGATTIRFASLTGLGGTGQQLLVEVGTAGGSGAPGAFTLEDGPIVTPLYTYDLVLGGDGNWYLEGTQHWDQGEFPIAAAATLQAWHVGVGRLHQRLTEATRLMDRGPPQNAALGAGDAQEAVRAQVTEQPLGAWVQVTGESRDVAAGTGRPFTQDSTQIMGGFDLGGRGVLAEGDLLLAGAFGHVLSSKADVGDSASEYDLEGGGGGLYAAWRLGGFDLSAIVKLDSVTIDQSTPSVVFQTEYDALALGGSLAAGWRFDLSGAWLRPAGELAFVHAWVDSFDDPAGDKVVYDDGDSLTGRLKLQGGIRFAWMGASFEPYAELGVAHEFLGDSSATVNAISERIDLGGTSFEAGGGLVVRDIADHLSLSLDADYATGESGKAVSLAVSLRFAW